MTGKPMDISMGQEIASRKTETTMREPVDKKGRFKVPREGPKGTKMRHTKNHWYQLFNRYDHDKDGKIAIGQFTMELNRDNNIDPEVLEVILKRADENRDITFAEFYELIQSKDGKTMTKLFSTYIIHTVPRRKFSTRVDHTDGEYEEEYSCNPPTLCMLIVSLVEIGVFLFDYYNSGFPITNGPAAKVLIYDPHRRKEAWRFMTYMFVHVGALNLSVNVIVQLMLGIPLEMVHGWRVLIIYLSGVFAGSLCTSVSDPNVYLAGASGGVYAIIAAHIATLVLNWSEMRFAKFQLLVFLILISVDVGTAVHNRYVLHIDRQIGYAAHLGGAIAGLLVGIYVLRNIEVRSWEKKIWWIALFIYLALMGGGILINVMIPE